MEWRSLVKDFGKHFLTKSKDYDFFFFFSVVNYDPQYDLVTVACAFQLYGTLLSNLELNRSSALISLLYCVEVSAVIFSM